MTRKHAPRILIAGTSSGCGKTTVTCGILWALSQCIPDISAFKCGPDYIDPMFHRKTLGVPSYNLDSFFYESNTLKYLTGKHCRSFSVVEGVMGYYDGRSFTSLEGSSCEIGNILEIPTILVINGKGAGQSILPMIQGFLQYQEKNTIQGVILNQVSSSTFQQLKPFIEDKFSGNVKVLGYVPPLAKHLIFHNRHLGLITATELENIQENLAELGKILSETLLLEDIIALGQSAPPLSYEIPEIEKISEPVRIAVGRDEAFSFYYEDNLELLEEYGAELVFFSPLHQRALPENIDGLYLGGGYPELYLEMLSENHSMKESIYDFLEKHQPCIAECGGFMYLCKDIQGFSMVGYLDASCYNENKLGNFGYITLSSEQNKFFGKSVKNIKAHEFHYYNATEVGHHFQAVKANGKSWKTGYATEHFYGAYPHLPFYSNLAIPEAFLQACVKKRREYETKP